MECIVQGVSTFSQGFCYFTMYTDEYIAQTTYCILIYLHNWLHTLTYEYILYMSIEYLYVYQRTGNRKNFQIYIHLAMKIEIKIKIEEKTICLLKENGKSIRRWQRVKEGENKIISSIESQICTAVFCMDTTDLLYFCVLRGVQCLCVCNTCMWLDASADFDEI